MSTGNGSLTSPVSMVVLLFALIGGVAAIILPMQQSIDNLNQRIERTELELKEARTIPTTETVARLAEFGKQFAEVETQFKWMRETMAIEILGHQKRLAAVEANLQAGQNDGTRVHVSHEERIKELERLVKK